MSFEQIFKHIAKASSKDPDAVLRKAGDIKLGSSVPFGIPTGIPRLDISLGRTGLPAGRVIEFFGFEGCGKSTAALHVLAQAQRLGGGGILIDTEFAFDEDRATEIGVDIDNNFAPSEVDTIEAVFRQIERSINGLIESDFNKPFIIIVDSVTGVASEHERDKEFGSEARVGQDARVIRQGMRRIMPSLAKSKACLLFINHAISKVAANPYAKQSQASGGHAIKFYSTVRCEFSNAGMEKDDNHKRLGQKINITVEKLKKSRLEYPAIKNVFLSNDNGFDMTEELLEAATMVGFVKHPSGSKTYSLNDKEFARADWPTIVGELGGPQVAYEAFLKWCKQNGKIKPWDSEGYE